MIDYCLDPTAGNVISFRFSGAAIMEQCHIESESPHMDLSSVYNTFSSREISRTKKKIYIRLKMLHTYVAGSIVACLQTTSILLVIASSMFMFNSDNAPFDQIEVSAEFSTSQTVRFIGAITLLSAAGINSYAVSALQVHFPSYTTVISVSHAMTVVLFMLAAISGIVVTSENSPSTKVLGDWTIWVQVYSSVFLALIFLSQLMSIYALLVGMKNLFHMPVETSLDITTSSTIRSLPKSRDDIRNGRV